MKNIFNIMLTTLLLSPFSILHSADVNFEGTLTADTCEIYPGDESVELDFGTTIDRYLYLNTRTSSRDFIIRLMNCDLQAKAVKVSFNGIANPYLPGLLALDNTSSAKGIAIGLEDISSNKISINTITYTQNLAKNENTVLQFRAYIQGEPEALNTKSITRGDFIATATFTLDYE